MSARHLLWLSIACVYAFQLLHVVIPADATGGTYSWSASVGIILGGVGCVYFGLLGGASDRDAPQVSHG